MPEKGLGQEGAATAASTQPIELSKSDPAIDNQQTIKPSQKKQEIAALRRDFIAEALRIAAVKAAHAADDIEIGDDIAVERGISLTITHLKAAAAEFRQMQAGSL
jgi:type II secretory pathway component HofQ